MDIDQLAQELAMLKEDAAASKAQQRMGGFIDKYGMKFGNDSAIANLILAEMDRRGVDEASEAASEAVQGVLDKLREEATAVLDKIKQQETEVSDLADKISTIEESVNAAKSGQEEPSPDMGGAPPDMGGDAPPDMGGGAPPDMGGGAPPDMGGGAPPDMGGGAPPDMGGAPPDMGGAPPDMGGAPPDMGGAPPDMGGAPPDMGGAPPDMGGAPPTDPNMVPSDVRIKQLRSQFQAYAQKRKGNVPSDQRIKAWKPRAETLSVLKGLM